MTIREIERNLGNYLIESLNQRVPGSSPGAPTIETFDLIKKGEACGREIARVGGPTAVKYYFHAEEGGLLAKETNQTVLPRSPKCHGAQRSW